MSHNQSPQCVHTKAVSPEHHHCDDPSDCIDAATFHFHSTVQGKQGNLFDLTSSQSEHSNTSSGESDLQNRLGSLLTEASTLYEDAIIETQNTVRALEERLVTAKTIQDLHSLINDVYRSQIRVTQTNRLLKGLSDSALSVIGQCYSSHTPELRLMKVEADYRSNVAQLTYRIESSFQRSLNVRNVLTNIYRSRLANKLLDESLHADIQVEIPEDLTATLMQTIETYFDSHTILPGLADAAPTGMPDAASKDSSLLEDVPFVRQATINLEDVIEAEMLLKELQAAEADIREAEAEVLKTQQELENILNCRDDTDAVSVVAESSDDRPTLEPPTT